jgi:hypothetical protein
MYVHLDVVYGILPYIFQFHASRNFIMTEFGVYSGDLAESLFSMEFIAHYGMAFYRRKYFYHDSL